MNKRQCIYAIVNAETGRTYIGSTTNYAARLYTHMCHLRLGKHHAIHMQRAWNIHGPGPFHVIIVEDVPDVHSLIAREQYWIDRLDTYRTGYNCAPVAGRPSSAGRPHTPETIAKMKMLRRLRPPVSDETRAKMSASAKLKRLSPDHKKRIGNAARGRVKSKEECAKLSAALKGRPKDNQQTGRKRSSESRALMAIAQAARHERGRAGLSGALDAMMGFGS